MLQEESNVDLISQDIQNLEASMLEGRWDDSIELLKPEHFSTFENFSQIGQFLQQLQFIFYIVDIIPPEQSLTNNMIMESISSLQRIGMKSGKKDEDGSLLFDTSQLLSFLFLKQSHISSPVSKKSASSSSNDEDLSDNDDQYHSYVRILRLVKHELISKWKSFQLARTKGKTTIQLTIEENVVGDQITTQEVFGDDSSIEEEYDQLKDQICKIVWILISSNNFFDPSHHISQNPLLLHIHSSILQQIAKFCPFTHSYLMFYEKVRNLDHDGEMGSSNASEIRNEARMKLLFEIGLPSHYPPISYIGKFSNFIFLSSFIYNFFFG